MEEIEEKFQHKKGLDVTKKIIILKKSFKINIMKKSFVVIT